tara:strand:+ start:5337 stop:6365 length:1029 start_codon:yes stop_codon:yes gene_type:complete
MKKRYYFCIVYFLINIASAQYRDKPDVVTKVATSAGNWLKLGTSARSAAMGGAFVAFGEGVTAIPYNPAGLAYIKGSEAYFSRTNYLADITYNVIAYGSSLSPYDYFGINLFYLDSGPMAVTTEQFPNGTGEDFNVLSLSLRLAYARVMTDRLKIGVTVNYIRDEIYTTHMQTLAFDIGSNFNTGIYGFTLGMNVSNFGPEVQYQGEGLQVIVPDTLDVEERLNKVTDKFPLPLLFRLGLKNELMGSSEDALIKSSSHKLTISADANNPIDYTLNGSIGGEYSFKNLAFLRAGTRLGHDTAGFSAGGGLIIGTGKMKIKVDYAFIDYGILEMMHQVGLGLEF